MPVFYGIDGATAALFFGSRAEELESVRYEGQRTEESPRYSGNFKHVDTYTVARLGEREWVDEPGWYRGTEFDIVITDHGIGRRQEDHPHRYTVELVQRKVGSMSGPSEVVWTADIDRNFEDRLQVEFSPVTVHRTAMQMVVDESPLLRDRGSSDVL